MKYDITYACGHDGQVELFGPNKERQWKLKKHAEGLCPDCEKKRIHEEVLRLKEEWKQTELPELQGPDMQIYKGSIVRTAQLETARQKMAETEKWISGMEESDPKKADAQHKYELYKRALKVALEEYTNAGDWAFGGISLDAAVKKTYEKYGEHLMDSHEVLTVEPEVKKTDVIAYINERTDSGNTYTTVRSGKDAIIIDTLKGIGYTWNTLYGEWSCRVTDRDASKVDALAYVTAKLLAAGVAVNADSKVIDAAVSGNYVPKALRYIWYSDVTKDYRIIFPYGDECTSDVKKMGARWNRDHYAYALPEGAWQKIEDLESLYNFKISRKTKAHIDELRGAPKVKVEVKEQVKGKGLTGVLESSREVLPDLMDD